MTNRWERIVARFSQVDPGQPRGDRLCAVACDVLNTPRVAVGLLTGNYFVPVAATDDIAQSLVDQQFALGDGPAFEAARTDTPVLAPDLTAPTAGSRWPAYAPVVLHRQVRAEFAFPLRVGAARIGVLTAFGDTPTTLDPNMVADAMVLATFAADVLVGLQAGEGDQTAAFASNFINHSEVHQAAGMVSEQLGISILDALIRLRSHAYASNTPLSVVARNVIDGHLTLDP
jgi:hypothetical protein